MKKVVVIGGGNGQSTLVKGLKKFPLDITAIVTVADNGRSTGRLRKEFHTPAVGDVRRVLVALAETEPLVEKLFNYTFDTTSDLNGHKLGNLILTGATEITGSLTEGVESLSKVFNLKGKVIPLTEDYVTLVAKMDDGTIIEGEEEITFANKRIEKVYYKEEPSINISAINAIKEADAIVLSMGSLFTSIIPNLISKDIIDAIDSSKAKIIYVSNMMTQPGETDNFTVSDHVNLLNSYLGKRKIDTVIVNNKTIDLELIERYKVSEQKDQVVTDYENLKDVNVVEDDLFIVENKLIRHDSLKLAFNIFAEIYK